MVDLNTKEYKWYMLPIFDNNTTFENSSTKRIFKKSRKLATENNGRVYNSTDCDWREIIYQMALDYFAHNQEDDFLVKIKNNNYIGGEYLFPNGYTGYEQYYTDLQGFWRTLYDIEPEVVRESIGGKYEDVKVDLDPVEGTYKIDK
jgi:hypothetical protein